jgi:hypothetical protein
VNFRASHDRTPTSSPGPLHDAATSASAPQQTIAGKLREVKLLSSQERTIGEISARIGGSVNLESILQTAIQELGNTLPGVDVAIQFTDTLEKQ